MELLLIINSCRLASAQSITVITPYFPYSKGDQKSSLRSPITAKLMANMIKKAGANQIMMLDAHSPQLEGFFDHPVDCLKVRMNTGGSCDFSVTPGSKSSFFLLEELLFNSGVCWKKGLDWDMDQGLTNYKI